MRGTAGAQDQTCTAGVTCTIGPFTGTALSTDDALALVPSSGTCGTSDKDSAAMIAQGAYVSPVTVASFTLSTVDLPKGGIWKLCYCPNLDAGADYTTNYGAGAAACAAAADFAVDTGALSVAGGHL